MPMYDFRCSVCGHVQEKIFPTFNAAVRDPVLCDKCNSITIRCISAPASVQITGFSAMNGYASPRSISQRRGNVKTTVSGNFEAFSDGLVNS